MDQILKMYGGVRMPPTIKEVAAELETTIDIVGSLMRFATQQSILIDLGKGFFIADDAFQMLCHELFQLFEKSPHRSVAEIRDQWQVTRKHAIPLLEYCDQTKLTQRDGDARSAGPRLNQMFTASEQITSAPPSEQSIEQD